jgi:cytochrome c-type biogenesis protein CcmE
MTTRKRRRLTMLLVCGVGLGSAAGLSIYAMRSSITYFMLPSAVAETPPPTGQVFRLGGLVQQGSLVRGAQDGTPDARFTVTDGRGTVRVDYAGILPDLFREGQGIVALGSLRDGVFEAQEVLAKHDSTYMPKDVADALKKAGLWQPGQGAPPPAAAWNEGNIRQARGG